MALPASIDTLKSTIGTRGGPAKANRFAVYLSHPQSKNNGLLSSVSSIAKRAASSLITGGSFGPRSFFEDPRDMFLLCDSLNIPGRQILTQEYATDMRMYRKPYSFVNDDVTMSFILTEDYYVFDYIKMWMDSIIQKSGERHFTVNYKENYSTDIIIQQISGGADFIPTYSIKLKNAYPVTLNSVALGNSAENIVSTANVSFAYDDWEKQGLIESLTPLSGIIGSTLIDIIS